MVPRARACRFSSVTSRGAPANSGGERSLRALHRAFDRHDVVLHAERLGDGRGIVERVLRGEAIRQHHAAHALGAERIDRHRRAQRGIDAAGEAEHDALEAVLVDVVAQAEHAGGVVGLLGILGRRDRPVRAAPRSARARPVRRHHGLAERRQLERERAVGIERERGAVEHQLVLAADLVDVDERQAALGDARDRDVEADVALVAPIGRAVRHDQHFGAGLGQALDHSRAPQCPDILADRHAEAHAAEVDRPGQRARREHALLVEHAVVRQVDLEADGRDAAAVEQRIGVVELAVLDPGRADEHRRAAVGGLARQLSTAARQAAWNAGLSTRSSGG